MKNYFIWLLKLITLIVLFLFIVPLVLVAVMTVTESKFAGGLAGENNLVAVVELTGIIDKSRETVEELYRQVEDKQIKGIVLRIDSPGGSVGPSQDIYNAVKKLKEQKPIIASMGGVAASGGLYAALGAKKIFCAPGTLTGSIGVIMQIPNVEKVAEKIGVDMITVKSGHFKDVGNSFREMTEEERAFLESTISKVHDQFIQAVVDGRGIPVEKVREFADGRVLLGSQAKELNVVDEFGDVYDAARAVFEILGEPLKENEIPKLFYPGDKFGDIKKLLKTSLSFANVFKGGIELRYIMN